MGARQKARVQASKRLWQPNRLWYLAGRVFWGWVFGILGPMRVQGTEHVPASGPAIVASNHVSGLDPFALGCACPRWPQFLAKHELFRVPIFGYLLRQWGAIPIDRDAADIGSARAALQVLRAGEVLAIFPEGTRSLTGQLQEFHPGTVNLALKQRVPIVPAVVTGSDRVLPKGARLPRRHPIRVIFGPPLRLWEILPDGSEASRQAGVGLLRKQVLRMMNDDPSTGSG
ncbi:MAG: 1-acyl-sn-glycerol-3-phosphate acyltransferase [Chloroflexi bacterium]|nr:1-acyl-sn-glycerol-3-phosphate acyltransferase [Chloroflexota bacterium]